MMRFNDPLRPENIDEYVERWAPHKNEPSPEETSHQQFISNLYQHYETKKHQETLANAWENISQHYDRLHNHSLTQNSEQGEQELTMNGQYIERERAVLPATRGGWRFLSLLVASFVCLLLIGSMALLAYQNTQSTHTAGGGGNGTTPCVPVKTSTPTPVMPYSETNSIDKASPTPAQTLTPEVTKSLTPTPEASPTLSPTPTPEATPTSSPTPTPEASPTSLPTPTPEANSTSSPTPTPEANSTPSPTPMNTCATSTPEFTPTPVIGYCEQEINKHTKVCLTHPTSTPVKKG